MKKVWPSMPCVLAACGLLSGVAPVHAGVDDAIAQVKQTHPPGLPGVTFDDMLDHRAFCRDETWHAGHAEDGTPTVTRACTFFIAGAAAERPVRRSAAKDKGARKLGVRFHRLSRVLAVASHDVIAGQDFINAVMGADYYVPVYRDFDRRKTLRRIGNINDQISATEEVRKDVRQVFDRVRANDGVGPEALSVPAALRALRDTAQLMTRSVHVVVDRRPQWLRMLRDLRALDSASSPGSALAAPAGICRLVMTWEKRNESYTVTDVRMIKTTEEGETTYVLGNYKSLFVMLSVFGGEQPFLNGTDKYRSLRHYFVTRTGAQRKDGAADGRYRIVGAVGRRQGIPGAVVTVADAHHADRAFTVHADAHGRIDLADTSFSNGSGDALAIKAPGYLPRKLNCPCTRPTLDLVPAPDAFDSLTVVIAHGDWLPGIDMHLVFPQYQLYREHPSLGQAEILVGVTPGSALTAIRFRPWLKHQRYLLAVHDGANATQPLARALNKAFLRVSVYAGNTLVATDNSRDWRTSGNTRIAFSVDRHGAFKRQDLMLGTYTVEDGDLGAVLAPMLGRAALFQRPGMVPAVSVVEARQYMRQGEAVYRAKQYDKAIELLRKAVKRDPSLAQAYADLGLAYARNGQPAAAVWAGHQALGASASRADAVLRAGVLYNIGRIYEQHQRFGKASYYYHQAGQVHANPVYAHALQRVRDGG